MADPVPYVTGAPRLPAGYGPDGSHTHTAQAAYTQTYATAARSVPAATQAAVATTAATALTPNGYSTSAQADAIVAAVNAAAADILALKKVVNALIDDLQALNLAG